MESALATRAKVVVVVVEEGEDWRNAPVAMAPNLDSGHVVDQVERSSTSLPRKPKIKSCLKAGETGRALEHDEINIGFAYC